jgi:HPt (histidine-containing phosphotransfer) domain-containing protein
MGGSLTVHSAGAGMGATFTLRLPLKRKDDTQKQPSLPGAVEQAPAGAAADIDDSLSKPGRAFQEPAITPKVVERLRELADDGDDDILTELIDTFLRSAPRMLADANDANSRRAPGDLALAAHTLQGSCSNFGAKPLRELAEHLETLARSPDFHNSSEAESQAGQMLNNIQRELDRVSLALGAYRNSL